MLINNIDIATFNARYLSKDIQTAEVTIYDDWLRNASNPSYLGKQEKYKRIKIKLLIKDIDDESALNDISNIVKQLEKCVLKFDDLSYYYDCTIVNKSHERSIVSGVYTLDVELKAAYAYKPLTTETLSHVSSKTINVVGNTQTPAILTLTAPVDTISITINGFGLDSIIINNLKANIPIVIDGESCKVTQNNANKFGDTDFWEFPKLMPGAKTISVSNPNCILTIQYKPRWM